MDNLSAKIKLLGNMQAAHAMLLSMEWMNTSVMANIAVVKLEGRAEN